MAGNDSKVFHPDIESVEEFMQRFKLQNNDVLSKSQKDTQKQAMHLPNALPIDVLTNIQRRLKPTLLTDATYEEIEENLVASYGVKKSLVGASVSFLNRKQKQQESIEEFSKALNQLASQCNFKDCCRDRLIRDVFLSGLRSSKLIRTLVTDCENKSFHECIERAKVIEQVTLDVEDINPTFKHSFDSHLPKIQHVNNGHSRTTFKKRKNVPKNYKCIRCGKTGNHLAQDCFALKKTCHSCSKQGHLSNVCKTKKISKHHHLSEHQDASDNEQYTVINKMFSDVNNSSRKDSTVPVVYALQSVMQESASPSANCSETLRDSVYEYSETDGTSDFHGKDGYFKDSFLG